LDVPPPGLGMMAKRKIPTHVVKQILVTITLFRYLGSSAYKTEKGYENVKNLKPAFNTKNYFYCSHHEPNVSYPQLSTGPCA
jgi:hypothetical protein